MVAKGGRWKPDLALEHHASRFDARLRRSYYDPFQMHNLRKILRNEVAHAPGDVVFGSQDYLRSFEHYLCLV